VAAGNATPARQIRQHRRTQPFRYPDELRAGVRGNTEPREWYATLARAVTEMVVRAQSADCKEPSRAPGPA